MTDEPRSSPGHSGTNRFARDGFYGGSGAVLLILVLVLVFPTPTPAQWTVFRIVIALGGAGYALALAGFLTVKLAWEQRVAISAGGTLAVFIVLFFFDPAKSVFAESHDTPVPIPSAHPSASSTTSAPSSTPSAHPSASSTTSTPSSTEEAEPPGVAAWGVDDHGRRADFKILPVAHDSGFTWTFNKSEAVMYSSKSAAPLDYLKSPGMQKFGKGAIGMIAVGSASQEGNSLEQAQLAADRADLLRLWLNQAYGPPVYTLNLGKHLGAQACKTRPPLVPDIHVVKGETACQREVVIVAITFLESKAMVADDIKEAVRRAWVNAMMSDAGSLKQELANQAGRDILPYSPNDFPDFYFSEGKAKVHQ